MTAAVLHFIDCHQKQLILKAANEAHERPPRLAETWSSPASRPLNHIITITYAITLFSWVCLSPAIFSGLDRNRRMRRQAVAPTGPLSEFPFPRSYDARDDHFYSLAS